MPELYHVEVDSQFSDGRRMRGCTHRSLRRADAYSDVSNSPKKTVATKFHSGAAFDFGPPSLFRFVLPKRSLVQQPPTDTLLWAVRQHLRCSRNAARVGANVHELTNVECDVPCTITRCYYSFSQASVQLVRNTSRFFHTKLLPVSTSIQNCLSI